MVLCLLNECYEKSIVFEVIGDETSAHKGRQFLIVNLDVTSVELKFKKGLVGELLMQYATSGRNVDWRELDIQIAAIMNAKVHTI